MDSVVGRNKPGCRDSGNSLGDMWRRHHEKGETDRSRRMVGSESGTAFPDGGETGEELKGLNVATRVG